MARLVAVMLFVGLTPLLALKHALALDHPVGNAAAQAPAPADSEADARPAAPSRAELVALIDRTAERYAVERDLVHAIVKAESGYNPRAVSPAGAIGLMQVMPETARDYGVESIDALFEPATNVRTGVRHLKRLLSWNSLGRAVMAYNAGEGALERANGFVAYPETQRYTHQVLTDYLRKKAIAPYSDEARALTGVALYPAMARARPSEAGSRLGPAARLRVTADLSRLSLRLRPSLLESTLPKRALEPSVHRVGPDSKPMFVLEPGVLRR